MRANYVPPYISLAFYLQYIKLCERQHPAELYCRAYDAIKHQIRRNKKYSGLINALHGGTVFVRRLLPIQTKFVNLIDAMAGVYLHSQETQHFDKEFSKPFRYRTWKWEWKYSTYAILQAPDAIREDFDLAKISLESFENCSIIWAPSELLFFELSTPQIKKKYKSDVKDEIETLVKGCQK